MTPETGGTAIGISLALWIVSLLVSFAGYIWLLVRAFRVQIGWGLAVLLLPAANLVFAVVHWKKARAPFLVQLAGTAMILAAAYYLKDGIQTLAASKTPAATGADSAAAVETRPESGEEAGIPLSDREKVADLLQDAGIDPAVPRTFVGKSLEAMQEVLGKPSATLRAQDKVVYIFYNCFEVESIDGGKSVSRVHYMGE